MSTNRTRKQVRIRSCGFRAPSAQGRLRVGSASTQIRQVTCFAQGYMVVATAPPHRKLCNDWKNDPKWPSIGSFRDNKKLNNRGTFRVFGSFMVTIRIYRFSFLFFIRFFFSFNRFFLSGTFYYFLLLLSPCTGDFRDHKNTFCIV